MKRFITYILTIAFAATGCNTICEVEGVPEFELSHTELQAANSGEILSVEVTSKVNWTAEADVDWLTLKISDIASVDGRDADNGFSSSVAKPFNSDYAGGYVTVDINVAANNNAIARSGNVVFSAVGGQKYSLQISQSMGDSRCEIRYTTTSGYPYNIIDSGKFRTGEDGLYGVSILSHTYENGEGVIVFDKDITVIKGSAFANYVELESMVIPNSVTLIDYRAFAGCTNLTSVTLGNSVTTIEDRVFYDCANLTTINLPNSLRLIGSFAFWRTNLDDIVIPEDVEIIWDFAFSQCNNLKKVVVPKNVNLASAVFAFCQNLEEATVPYMRSWLFEECPKLKKITFNNDIIGVGEAACYGCTSLKEITIPDCVVEIADSAFGQCSSLESVTIGNGVTAIGNWAFKDCSSLTNLTIGSNVTVISYGLFSGCSSLVEVTIPENVRYIDEYAFSDCSSLSRIYCKPTVPPEINDQYGSDFKNAPLEHIYVPVESVNAYKNAAVWSKYADKITGYTF